MTTSGEYPAEEYLGSDSSGRNDAARDEADRLNPDFEEALEGDDDLRPDSMVDLTELDEVGALLEDPEQRGLLQGAADDPDGVGAPTGAPVNDEGEGWDLDAPLAPGGSEKE